MYHAVSEIHSIVVDTENTGGVSNLSKPRARHTRVEEGVFARI